MNYFSEQVQGDQVCMRVECTELDCENFYAKNMPGRAWRAGSMSDRDYFVSLAEGYGWEFEGYHSVLCPGCAANLRTMQMTKAFDADYVYNGVRDKYDFVIDLAKSVFR